jgi:hypothetical protein
MRHYLAGVLGYGLVVEMEDRAGGLRSGPWAASSGTVDAGSILAQFSLPSVTGPSLGSAAAECRELKV